MQEKYDEILRALPQGIRRELLRVCSSRKDGLASVSEVHLTLGTRSSVRADGERIYLFSEVGPEDMRFALQSITGGAIYHKRESITDGYVSLPSGVRVGVCGVARYESERLVGVSDVSSLVFRIPTAASSLANELIDAWHSSSRGMLVYAKAGVGKTTALRTVVPLIAAEGVRVGVVDERCEFLPDECRRLGIVHLSGYKRRTGLEIALRTMSCEVVVVDELGSREESAAMLDSLNSGVRLLATAHGATREELCRRGGVDALVSNGVFDVLFGIFNTDGTYSCKIEAV